MKSKVFSRLGFKTGLAIVLVEAVALAFLGHDYTRRFSAQVDRSLAERVTKPAALMSERALKPEAVKQARAMQELVGPGLEYVLVANTNGHVLHATDRQWVGRSVTNVPQLKLAWLAEARTNAVLREVQEEGQTLLVSVASVMTDDERAVPLFICVRLRVTEAEREKARIARLFTVGSLATIAATSLAIALCFHWLMADRLRRIVSVVEGVAAGDLAARVGGQPGKDELGQLHRGVNLMAERLQRTIRSLEDSVAGLKSSEEKLRESEHRFRTLAEAAFEGLAFTERGVFVDLNDQLARMLGWRREDLLGQPVLTAVAPQSRDTLATALRDNRLGPYELLALRRDGSVFPVEVQARATTVDGRELRVTAIRDVTERKAAEARMTLRLRYEAGLAACSQVLLRDRPEAVETALRHLLDASGASRVYIFENFHDPAEGLCMRQTHEVCAPDVSVQIDNAALQHVPYAEGFERWREELSRGRAIAGLVEALPALERKLLESQDTLSILALPMQVAEEWHGFIGFDDTKTHRQWTQEDIQLLRTASEILCHHLHRKRTETHLHERTRLATLAGEVGAALTGSRGLPGMLHECAAAVVHNLDAAFARIWTLNEATQTLELQASAGLYTHLDGPHSLMKVGDLKIGRIARDRQPHLTNTLIGDPLISDQDWVRREGMAAFAGYPLLVGGRVVGVVALFARSKLSDFILKALGSVADQIALGIERKRAESDREKLNRELEHKNRELESLLYAASHDLRSPLVNIQGFGRRLERTLAGLSVWLHKTPADASSQRDLASVNEDVARSLRFILASVDKMNMQLHALLRLSRVGRVDLHLQRLDMGQMIQTLLQSMSFQVQAAGAAVEVGPLPTCCADEAQVNQVFTNLLDNALKYRDPARPLRLRITGRIVARESVYCVEDTGLGIAPAHQERIWELFHRLEPTGPVPGEGLGLTLVRRIVERHHGHVWVESEPGRGSRFFVALPAAAG